MISYNFCPTCGQAITSGVEPPVCMECDITFWRNSKPCASVLPIKDGKVLLAKRGVEPHTGAYCLIGGFMEAGEDPKVAAVREAKEETGLDVRLTGLLGIYTDVYGDSGDYTLSLQYLCEIIGGDMRPLDDVAELEWVDIDKVPLHDGFQNTRDALRDLKKLYHRSHLS